MLTSSTELDAAVHAIDQLVPDSRGGLPDSVFYLTSRLTPLINVDLLVVNESNEKLLTWRSDRFYGPGWHIPGGIIRFKEGMADRIQQVARSELGVQVEHDPQPLTIAEIMNPDRDVRGHFISMVFKCRLKGPLRESRRARSAHAAEPEQWHWFAAPPANLIMQHVRFADLISQTVY